MTTKQLTRIAIFSALALVLRLSFSHLPNIQPVTTLFLVFAVFFGFYESVLVMSLTMLISSFVLGFGPWVFWQLATFMLIIFLWTFLIYPLSQKVTNYQMPFISVLAGLCAVLYGIFIDSCFAYLYSMPWWSYVLAGAPFNLVHGLSTLLFYPIIFAIFRRLSHEKIF